MFIKSGTSRSRSLPGPTFRFRGWYRDSRITNDPWKVESDVRTSLGGTQVTESDGNLWPLPKKRDLQDYGSEFYSIKKEVLNEKFNHAIFFKKADLAYGAGDHKLDGPHIANCFRTYTSGSNVGLLQLPLEYSFPPDLSSSRSSLEVKGTQAIAACQPTNQIANAASFVGELMQDVPAIPGVHLWESRLRAAEIAARASGEFLNVVFGILPTIGDMDLFLKGVHKVDKAVDQLIRDAGRVVRRKFVFPTETSTSVERLNEWGTSGYSPVGVFYSSADNRAHHQFSPNLGPGFHMYPTWRKRTIERKIWFSGAFTYHLPSGYDAHSPVARRALMARLFGAQPDLNTLWQLTPWSWAADWFLDTGALIKNLQAHISYGSVLRYGYVMETTTVTDTFFAGEENRTVGPDDVAFPLPHPTPSTVHLRTTVKKRIKANPFGFGVSWDGLSTTQRAIAAALGITRVVK